jgi:hypothetical protein
MVVLKVVVMVAVKVCAIAIALLLVLLLVFITGLFDLIISGFEEMRSGLAINPSYGSISKGRVVVPGTEVELRVARGLSEVTERASRVVVRVRGVRDPILEVRFSNGTVSLRDADELSIELSSMGNAVSIASLRVRGIVLPIQEISLTIDAYTYGRGPPVSFTRAVPIVSLVEVERERYAAVSFITLIGGIVIGFIARRRQPPPLPL